MQRTSFRRLIGSAVAAAGLVAVLPVVAAAAGPIHTSYSVSTPANYCGIDVIFAAKVVDNFSPVYDSGGNLLNYTDNLTAHVTFTAANGKVVDLSFAGRSIGTTVANLDGTITVTTTSKGLQEKLSSSQGTTLSRDAGIFTVVDTFSSAGDLISETVTFTGPHPEVNSGFALFCQILTAGLT